MRFQEVPSIISRSRLYVCRLSSFQFVIMHDQLWDWWTASYRWTTAPQTVPIDLGADFSGDPKVPKYYSQYRAEQACQEMYKILRRLQ